MAKRAQRWFPTPEEAQRALGHVIRFLNLVFEVELGDGAWRPVRIGEHRPLRNVTRPELSLLAFKLEPLIVTPYLPEIRGCFFASRPGIERGVVSWIPTADMRHLSQLRQPEGVSRYVRFRCVTEDAANWFAVLLAKAGGMRYRNRTLLRQDRYEYRREP